MICLKYIFQGHIQSIAPNKGFGMFSGKLKEMINIINTNKFIEYLDHITSVELIEVKKFYFANLNSYNINIIFIDHN